MPAYLIAQIQVNNPTVYADYIRAASELVARYGGRYLIRSDAVIPLSGGWEPERIVVVEFPTTEDAQRCFASPEYQTIAPLRESSTTSRGILVEGLGTAQDEATP